MIVKILKALKDSEFYSKKSIARKLNVDEIMLEQMMSRMKEMGYIEEDNMNTCSGCSCGSSKSKSCCCDDKSTVNVTMWKITKKGNQLLDSNK